MLGIVARKSVDAKMLTEFRALAEGGKTPRDYGCEQISTRVGHPDGWGIACLAGDGSEVYRRSALKATDDPLYEATVREVSELASPPYILMAHLRRSSTRDTTKEEFNHPFRREVKGRTVFFGHNGNIEGFGVRDGRIDSQYLFEHVLSAVDDTPVSSPGFNAKVHDVKTAIAAEFPKKVTSLTFLLSDGQELIAHRDARQCKPYYSLHQTRTPGALIVCSEVLPAVPGNWRLLRNDETVAMSPSDI